jgi:small subunit ribosomal protein S4
MARYTGPKCRLCRREGEKLFLKGTRCFTEKCPFERKRYPPGVHGPDRRVKLSIYGMQLREKQKVKRIYGILEAQCRKYFEMARKTKENTGEVFLSLLERRLDNVVYQLGFASSRSQARQLVNHGHVFVNGKKVDIPSYLVKEGDEITLKLKAKQFGFVNEALENRDPQAVPAWLQLDKENRKGKVLRLPTRADITHPINERLIIEFYSK